MDEEQDKPYHEALGSIMYAQISTHPNLSFSISTLSKFSLDPGCEHWCSVIHVFQYIKGTLHYTIVLEGKGFNSIMPYRYVDSNYGGDIDTRCSCAGHILLQSGRPTAWGSQYQLTVTLSMTEAEYMVLMCSARQLLWMHSAMAEISYPQQKPACLIGDNLGSITLTKNTKQNSRVKHIDI